MKPKNITQWWKDVHNLRVILNVARMSMGLLQNYFWISSGKCFLFYLKDTQIEIMVNKKVSLRVSHELSIYLRYLHQDQNLSIRSLSRTYPSSLFQLFEGMQQKKVKFIQSKQKGRVDVNLIYWIRQDSKVCFQFFPQTLNNSLWKWSIWL